MNFVKWSHTIYNLKAHSSRFNMVQLVFQNNEQRQSYEDFNGHRYIKNCKKVGSLTSHFCEAIQAIKVNFLPGTQVNLGYSHAKFRPILRGSRAKLRWTDMEWPLSLTGGTHFNFNFIQVWKIVVRVNPPDTYHNLNANITIVCMMVPQKAIEPFKSK